MWPEPSDGRLFCTVPWLRAFRDRMEGTHRWFLASAYGATPGAAVMGTVVQAPPSEAKNVRTLLSEPCDSLRTPDRMDLGRLAALAPHCPPWADWSPSLVVTYPGFECLAARSSAAGRPDVDALVRLVLEEADRAGWATVAFLFVPPAETLLHDALTRAGLVPFHNAVSSVLDLPGAGFDDYLAALSRKQRADARRVRRLSGELGWAVRDGGLDPEAVRPMVDMRIDERRKHGRRIDRRHEEAVFETMHDHFAERVSVLLVSDRDGPAGFSLYLNAGHDTEHAWTQGVRGGHEHSRDLYLACTYYEPIRRAYRTGVRRIDFGYGTEKTKRHRGCSPVRLTGYLWARDPAVRDHARRVAEEVLAP